VAMDAGVLRALRATERDGGLVFSLFPSCEDDDVSEESAGSSGSEEGSGARKRGEGGRAMGRGGGMLGIGNSVCAI
jgi:hypothetical protein